MPSPKSRVAADLSEAHDDGPSVSALANDDLRACRATLSVVVIHAAKSMVNYKLASPYITLSRR
jgi:hypothetical protein